MSRTRTYGKSVAVMKDAIQEAEGDLMVTAYDRLNRTLAQQTSLMRALGIDSDLDSIEDFERDEEDQIVIGYKIRGRQRRNVFQRILWAIKL